MNENEVEYMGKIYVAVDPVGTDCVGCEFVKDDLGCLSIDAFCGKAARADKRDVIWILKENEHEAQ